MTLKAGGQYYQDTFNFRNQSTFTNNFWQAYAGYGGPSGRTTGISPIPANIYQGSVSLNNFIPGFNGSLPPSVFVFSPTAYQNYLTSLGNPYATEHPGLQLSERRAATACSVSAVRSTRRSIRAAS